MIVAVLTQWLSAVLKTSARPQTQALFVFSHTIDLVLVIFHTSVLTMAPANDKLQIVQALEFVRLVTQLVPTIVAFQVCLPFQVVLNCRPALYQAFR